MIRKLMKKPEIGVITSLIIVFALFGVMSKGAFLSIGVLKTVFAVSVELGIVAIGVTHVLVAAEIDLSVGSIYGFSALMFAKMYKMLSPGLAAIVVLVLGMGIGFANGYIRVKTRVPSLIVTLGSMMTLRGIIYFVTGGFTQSVKASFFTKILGSDILDPLWLILVAFIFTVVLTRTPFGNRLLATGGNIETARTLGVKVDKIRVVAFMISSTLASLAGLISISRLRVASATHGELMELEAIAAAVMGGTLLTGGYGSVVGSTMGAILIASLRSGLLLSGAPSYWYVAFLGIILVVASVINLTVVRKLMSSS
ncbi:MAG: ABC transporter permease [Thermotogae bacterium]|nr:ABC transporter permease [Thermotogota bacterium]